MATDNEETRDRAAPHQAGRWSGLIKTMDSRIVFTKTPKGAAEVTTRGGALTLTARRVLIMVDGKRSVGDLSPLLRPGEIDGVLANLEAQGYVLRTGGEVPPPPPRALAPGNPLDVPTVGGEPEERNLVTLDEAKRRAVRELIERLGPEADSMAQRIERCTSADDLRDRLREAERLIAGMLGETVAQDYVRALRRRV
jgi:hypothetical protein